MDDTTIIVVAGLAFLLVAGLGALLYTVTSRDRRPVIDRRVDPATSKLEARLEVLLSRVDDCAHMVSLIGIETAVGKEHAQEDRNQMQRTVARLEELMTDVSTGVAAVKRIEAGNAVVAANLADAHRRANLSEGRPGDAADSFARTEDASDG